MRNNLSTPLIIQSRTILYYHTSKLLLPSKSPLFAYKLVCIEQPGRPGCNNLYKWGLDTRGGGGGQCSTAKKWGTVSLQHIKYVITNGKLHQSLTF